MRLTFIGAARAVTGSCILVESNSKKFLIDCGLPQGNDVKSLGVELPFKGSDIDYVLLTHAHIDHSGRIPLLVKEGFRGAIHSTVATADLCSIMLADSGHIQEMESEWLNRKNKRAGLPAVEPLYTVEDAHRSLEQFEGHPYNARFSLTEGIEVEFTDAGHLLGSSSIQVWLKEGPESRHLIFSGDIGNLDQPIIEDPVCFTSGDFIIMESTYGDRLHHGPTYANQKEATLERAKQLAKIIGETFAKGGNVVIPSFAVGRTQELLYLLRYIKANNLLPQIPHLPVFLDSPLAIEATKVFSRNIEGYFDDEAMAVIERGENPLLFDSLVTTVTADESRELNVRKEPAVIISSSGMCEAGRIKHHLKHNLWRRESTILFCGYQAVGTLGRSILDGAKRVTIFGEKIEVRAAIQKLDNISGHADQEGLIKWLSCLQNKPQHVFVVHGEERVAHYFAGLLGSKLDLKAWAPTVGESYDLLLDKIPVAKEEKLWVSALEELKGLYEQLDKVFTGVQAIFNRLKVRGTELEKEPSGDAQRVLEAVSRFTQELDDINDRWGS
ncbi:MAG: MBL fold metallo-hydrolase [Sphaerochaetaceae bacterium]